MRSENVIGRVPPNVKLWGFYLSKSWTQMAKGGSTGCYDFEMQIETINFE